MQEREENAAHSQSKNQILREAMNPTNISTCAGVVPRLGWMINVQIQKQCVWQKKHLMRRGILDICQKPRHLPAPFWPCGLMMMTCSIPVSWPVLLTCLPVILDLGDDVQLSPSLSRSFVLALCSHTFDLTTSGPGRAERKQWSSQAVPPVPDLTVAWPGGWSGCLLPWSHCDACLCLPTWPTFTGQAGRAIFMSSQWNNSMNTSWRSIAAEKWGVAGCVAAAPAKTLVREKKLGADGTAF